MSLLAWMHKRLLSQAGQGVCVEIDWIYKY